MVPIGKEDSGVFVGKTIVAVQRNGKVIGNQQLKFSIDAHSVQEAFDKFKDCAEAEIKRVSQEAQIKSNLPRLVGPTGGRLN